MPQSDGRSVSRTRREGRRSHAAYESQARGVLIRILPQVAEPPPSRGKDVRSGTFCAGLALALVHPWVGRARGRELFAKGTCMTKRPFIRSLETVTKSEALLYMEHAGGDELTAAFALAVDRNRLDNESHEPDDIEVHHALFLLRRARGLDAPSFDKMRVELRRRAAA